MYILRDILAAGQSQCDLSKGHKPKQACRCELDHCCVGVRKDTDG